MSSWLVPLNELSREQRDAVEATAREHRVITGGPGSGKTQVLLHRTRHLLDQSRGQTSNCHIFVFTNVLLNYIQSDMKLLDLPEEIASTFDYWCMSYYQQKVSNRLPWNAEQKSRDWNAIREGVRKSVQGMNDAERLFDFVLVDEGQDLEPVAFDILNAISRHVTVLFDSKQQIYDRGSSENEILAKLGLRRNQTALLSTFRCSPDVVALAATFILDAWQRAEYLRQSRIPNPPERELPLLYIAADAEDERKRLFEIVRTRQARRERFAILLPTNRQVFGFANGLTEAGFEVEVQHSGWGQPKFPVLDFGTTRPKLLTYHSAKGLTFDSVLLPRLVPGSFHRGSTTIQSTIFVGITRATKWVYLSTVKSRDLVDMVKMRQLETERKLTIQTAGATVNSPLVNPRSQARDDDDDGMF